MKTLRRISLHFRRMIRRSSPLAKAAVAAALVLSIVTLLTLQGLTLAARQDTEALRQEAISLEQENQRLRGYLAEQGTVQEIMRIAQERLNMAMPDSIVIQPE